MHTTPNLQPSASPRRGVTAWGFGLLRWTLVLLLVADLIGSPLHHHHHDSGVDGTWSTVSVGHLSDGEAHAEDDGHDDHFGHATLAVRGSEAVKVASVADDTSAFIQAVTVLAVLWIPIEEAASQRPPPRWRSPFVDAYRSLPPAGRAPPFHA